MKGRDRRRFRPGSRGVNYSTLQYGHAGPVEEDVEDAKKDFETIQKGFLAFSSDSTACKSVEAGQLTPQHLIALDEPILVAASATSRQHMGLKLPSGSRLKPLELIQHLGFGADAQISGAVGRQDAPRWNMLQWLQYWNTRQLKQPGGSPQAERTKSVTSVDDEADSRDIRRRQWEAYMRSMELPAGIAKGISAEARRQHLSMAVNLSGSSMEEDFAAPSAVREVDLAERHRPAPKHSQASDAVASRLSKQLHMAPAGALLDFRLPPGGAATWVHVISGRKVYILIPGTPSNLGVYVSWYRCGGRQAGVFLPDHTSGALKVSVDAGETLFIPAGWVSAEMAGEDTVALRGHYLHLAVVQRHLEAARIEEHLDLGPAMRFPCFYEVLWHTAAAFAGDLMAAAALPAEQLSKQAALLAATRLKRQQATHVGAATVKKVDEGDDSDDNIGRPKSARVRLAQATEAGTGFVIKQASSEDDDDDLATQRPMKRLRRLSDPRCAEVAADLEDDLADETSEDDAGEDWDARSPPSVNPPKAPKQASQPTYYSDSPEEGSDEELKAMQNIRNRGRQRCDEGHQLLPKVRLRSGLRGRQQQPVDHAAKGSGSLRLRLKASPPDQAASERRVGHQRGSAGSPAERNGHKTQSRFTVKLGGGKQKQNTSATGVRQMGLDQRSQSLKVKFRVGGEGGSIPQVDGAADSDSDAAAFDQAHITEKPATAAESGAAMIGVHPSMTTAARDLNEAAAGDEQHPPVAVLNKHAAGAAVKFSSGGSREADAPPESSNLRAELQPAGPDASQSAQQPMATANGLAEPRAPDMEASNLQQAVGITDLTAAGSQQVSRPGEVAGECVELSGAPAPAHASGLELTPAASAAVHGKAPAAPPALQVGVVEHSRQKGDHSRLTDNELIALPTLVQALREWLDAQTGHIPGIGDPDAGQEALDRIEVCLRALDRPVAPLKYAVDFGSLPFVPIPPAEPAQAAPGSSGADDSGPAEDGPLSADEADDTAPEELGDSTREAQNRAAKRGDHGGAIGRGTKRKPTVKDRLAKKLRIG